MKKDVRRLLLNFGEKQQLLADLNAATRALERVSDTLTIAAVRQEGDLAPGTQRLLETAAGGLSVLRARVADTPVEGR